MTPSTRINSPKRDRNNLDVLPRPIDYRRSSNNSQRDENNTQTPEQHMLDTLGIVCRSIWTLITTCAIRVLADATRTWSESTTSRATRLCMLSQSFLATRRSHAWEEIMTGIGCSVGRSLALVDTLGIGGFAFLLCLSSVHMWQRRDIWQWALLWYNDCVLFLDGFEY